MMPRPIAPSLWQRTLLYTLVATSLAATFAWLAGYWGAYQIARGATEASLRPAAEALAASLAAGGIDAQEAQDLLDRWHSAWASEEVPMHLYLVDDQGQIIAASSPASHNITFQEAVQLKQRIVRMGPMNEFMDLRSGERLLGMTIPISGATVSYELHLLVPTAPYLRMARRAGWIAFGFMVLSAAAFLTPGIVALRRRVFTPLVSISLADQALAEGRSADLSQLRSDANDEIAALMRSRTLLLRRLQVLHRLGALMVSARDPGTLQDQALLGLVEALNCDRGTLWLLDRDGGSFVGHSEVRPERDEAPSAVGRRLVYSKEPVLRDLLQAKQVMVAGAAEMGGSGLRDGFFAQLGTDSMLVTPILWGEELIGFLTLDDTRQPHPFSPDEIALAEAGAALIAIAMEGARYRFAELERGRRMAALADLAATLSTRHSLEEVLAEVVSRGRALVDSATCTISLMDREGRNLELRAQVGLGEGTPEIRVPLDDPDAARLIRSGQPLVVEDIDRDMPRLRNFLARRDVRAIALWPLRVAGQVIGLLTLGYLVPHRPTEVELNVHETLASVAAAAIQNARAFESEVQQRGLLAAVAKISRRVSGILEPHWMLQEVSDLLARELEYDFVHVFLLQPGGGGLQYAAGSGEVGREIRNRGLRLPISSETAVGRAAGSGKPQRGLGEENGTFRQAHPLLAEVQSEVALPIVARNLVLGVLVVQSRKPHAFGAEDEQLLNIVTEQVSVALENARHHMEVQKQARLDSLTQVLNHGTFVETLHTLVDYCRNEGIDLSLIMLDVDCFKDYNDRFGHVAGDAALTTTVQAIRAHVKRRDAIGRWGGEEFGIALVGANKSQARQVAERIRATLALLTPVDRLGREMPAPTVSQGIATLRLDAEDADALVDEADRALYRAKAAGRDQVRLAGEA